MCHLFIQIKLYHFFLSSTKKMQVLIHSAMTKIHAEQTNEAAVICGQLLK